MTRCFRLVSLLALLVACAPGPSLRAAYFKAGQPGALSGQDFSAWTTILGDDVCNAPGEAPAAAGDVRTAHHGDFSALEANAQGRNIQAHNITYLSAINQDAVSFRHVYRFKFRVPTVPVKDEPGTYSQNLEGSIQLWDGTRARQDFIVAFSWVLNPFASPGTIQTWRAENDRGRWVNVGFLPVDTAWHQAELVLDPRNRQAEVRIDARAFPAQFARTARPQNWSSFTDSRVTIEGSSVWVCEGGRGVAMREEFKDWEWIWEP